jgi:glycosyltransferase involved in cell wall biosynthesis
LSIAFASHTLAVNPAMRERLVRLGVPPARVTVVANSPSLVRFDAATLPRRAFRADGSLRLIYAGALTPTYEVDVALQAVALLASTRPDLDVRFEVYGRGDRESALRALGASLGVADRVTFHGRIPIDAVPAAIAAADIGLAPTHLDAFTKLTMSTKIHEYAAMGKPVVASRLPVVDRTFPTGTVARYESGDVAGMAAAITAFADDSELRALAVERTARIVAETSWEHEAVGYVALVDRLALGGTVRLAQATPSRR